MRVKMRVLSVIVLAVKDSFTERINFGGIALIQL